MNKSNLDWEKGCVFVLAYIGDVNLFEYWVNKKKLNIDIQDEDGDTALHYAVRGGHLDLVVCLLEKEAIISWNKNQQSPLQLAYIFNQHKVAYEITQSIIKGKNEVDERQKLDLYINNFIKFLRKNYLDRSIFIRFPAKHTKRANALIDAANNCRSIKEFKALLNNQLNLFKNTSVQPLPKRIIDARWSKVIKNKPLNANKSHFYKTINAFVIERLSTEVNSKKYNNTTIGHRCFFKN